MVRPLQTDRTAADLHAATMTHSAKKMANLQQADHLAADLVVMMTGLVEISTHSTKMANLHRADRTAADLHAATITHSVEPMETDHLAADLHAEIMIHSASRAMIHQQAEGLAAGHVVMMTDLVEITLHLAKTVVIHQTDQHRLKNVQTRKISNEQRLKIVKGAFLAPFFFCLFLAYSLK